MGDSAMFTSRFRTSKWNRAYLALACAVSGLSAAAQTAVRSDAAAASPGLFRPYLVSISVANLDETITWYRDNLGFSIARRMELPKYSLRIAFMEFNGFQLELIEFRNSVPYDVIQKRFPEVDDRAKIQGLGKLAFVADNLEALATKLKSKKIRFFRDITRDEGTGQRSFIVSDNSGNWLQFFERS